MLTALEFLGLFLFIALITGPALFGLHLYLLVYLAARRSRDVRRQQREQIAAFTARAREADWPDVTTQIPLYNESRVARRVIEAVCRIDYPAGRHHIQVLDDSTDETRDIVDRAASQMRARGYDVAVIRRANRAHFKAGALAEGLTHCRSDYVAVFDADFVPPANFLRETIPLLLKGDDVACVQGRWEHLNADENWITRALSLALDMHFGVEQGARGWNGLALNFNGTAGVWRKAAILDPRVGGWSGDTITEDLDLSYRAQMTGWRIEYCPDVACPAELPADVDALKSHQRRWATGTIQTARKLLGRVWSSDFTLAQRLEASVHLTQYAMTVPVVLIAILGRPLPLMLENNGWPSIVSWLSTVFLLASVAPCVAYAAGRVMLGKPAPHLLDIIRLVGLGLGLCVNNAVASLIGLVQRGGEFVRTPKSGSSGGRRRPVGYARLKTPLWAVELALGLGCLVQWIVFVPIDGIGATYLLLYAGGLLALGYGSSPFRLTHRRRRPMREALESEDSALTAPLKPV